MYLGRLNLRLKKTEKLEREEEEQKEGGRREFGVNWKKINHRCLGCVCGSGRERERKT
ncbi:hypothetical protein LguiB_010214 [Lonicera macranthoides]